MRYRVPRHQHGGHGRAGDGGEDQGGMPEGTYCTDKLIKREFPVSLSIGNSKKEG